jgi:hypothetical protein
LIGYPIIIIEEGVTAIYGGPSSPEDWARFRILMEPNPAYPIDQNKLRRLRGFIDIYKPQRCHLAGVGLFFSLEDGPVYRQITEEIREEFEVEVSGDTIEWYAVVVDDANEFLLDAEGVCIVLWWEIDEAEKFFDVMADTNEDFVIDEFDNAIYFGKRLIT